MKTSIATNVVSWGANRLDVFALGTRNDAIHKAWNGEKWFPSTEGDWESLGGIFSSPLRAVSWGKHRLDIFGLGTDNQCYHKWWDGNNWGPGTNDWEALGGLFSTPITAVSWGSNRLDLFGLGTDNSMYHKWWDGSKWSPSLSEAWENLGGVFRSPPSVVCWASNRIDVFALGTDNSVYHKWWDGNNWQPGLKDWENLGRVRAFGSMPTAVSWGKDRLDVFALGTDNSMWHKWWDGRRWSPDGGDWENLGNMFNGPPSAVCWASDRIDLFGLGSDNNMWHKWWDGNSWQPGPGKGGWEFKGGTMKDGPSVAAWDTDRLDVFALGDDSKLYHQWWNGSSWAPDMTSWEELGGRMTSGN